MPDGERNLVRKGQLRPRKHADSYVRTNGIWLCALAQLTPVARENYPSDDTIVVRYLKGNLQL